MAAWKSQSLLHQRTVSQYFRHLFLSGRSEVSIASSSANSFTVCNRGQSRAHAREVSIASSSANSFTDARGSIAWGDINNVSIASSSANSFTENFVHNGGWYN